MKRYSAYKDSGIEWIGEIPEGWGVKRLKYLLKSVESGSRESQEQEFNDVDKIPSIGGEHISWSGNIEFTDNKFVSKKYFLRLKKGKIKTGDVLLVKDGATIGKTAFVKNEINAAINEHVFILRTNNNFKDGLLYYNLVSDFTQDLINLFSRGAAQAGLPSDFVSNIFLLIPPEPEQTAIATFLDHKTAKIDELIKKNEGLIELLKEKRQAIISHAVTKGLDPNAKMKDSGIEWLGEIREGWGVKKLKYVAEIVLGKMLQNEDSGKDELKPYMRAQNIQWEIVDITDVKEMWFSDYEIKKYRVQKGDLLISEGGEVGRTALWNGELEECYIQNSVHKVTVDKKLANNRYLLNLLKTYGKWGYFESIVNRVSIGHLTREKLKEIKIVCPPKNEQEQIVTYLDKKSSSMDEIIQKIQPQIEKLKEYRQALISNVVTGKVRVDES
ncbi:MAG: hypothetical protein A2W77_08295 [Nitrospinae bacterium RIFCSPLOWO2_12_39_16]|nr:MAG: hypothetical protein A2W77_08295 [Nitrospinae bacterium RIFCSPLOWO2_12_39_16]